MKFIEKVTVEDRTPERGLLFLIGPKAEAMIREVEKGLLVWREDVFKTPFFSTRRPPSRNPWFACSRRISSPPWASI